MILPKAREEAETLKRLYNSAFRFLIPLTAEETYRVIVGQAQKLIGARYCSLYIRKSGKLERVYSNTSKLDKLEIRPGGYTYRAFWAKKPSVISIEKVLRYHPLLNDMGVKSTVFIPLVYRGESVGLISADSFEREVLDSRDLEIFKLFGSMAMLAIRKSQLHNELSESLATRDLFISIASHELRTPLTTINSYAHLIKKNLAEGKKPEYRWSQILSAEVTRLILMVNELLQLDQIKTGTLEYHWEECSLKEVVRRAFLNLKAKYPERKVVFDDRSGNPEDLIMADFDKLLQAVLNIMANAAKYSPADSKIFVTIASRQSYFYLAIRDEGEGINKKDIKKVFEKFYKGVENKKGGLGIGLYLAKSIIEMHQGQIQVSSPDKGTLVEITLPKFKHSRNSRRK